MSISFDEAVKALEDNPELAKQVMAAGSPAERAEILKAAGVAVPTQADVSAAYASLSDVSGGGPEGALIFGAEVGTVAVAGLACAAAALAAG